MDRDNDEDGDGSDVDGDGDAGCIKDDDSDRGDDVDPATTSEVVAVSGLTEDSL